MKSHLPFELLDSSKPTRIWNNHFTCEKVRNFISDSLKELNNRHILNNNFIDVNILSEIRDVQFEEDILNIRIVTNEQRAISLNQNVFINRVISEVVSIPLKSIESVRKENSFIVLDVQSGMLPITIVTQKNGYRIEGNEKKDIKECSRCTSSVYAIYCKTNDIEIDGLIRAINFLTK